MFILALLLVWGGDISVSMARAVQYSYCGIEINGAIIFALHSIQPCYASSIFSSEARPCAGFKIEDARDAEIRELKLSRKKRTVTLWFLFGSPK